VCIAYVLPTRGKLNEVFRDDIIPLVKDTPPLAKLMTPRANDLTGEHVRLANNVIIQGLWAGSASSLATHPFGVVILDECDKYPVVAGIEAEPIGPAHVRTQTIGDRGRQVFISTPTDA
jgi:phage terminase large subunit GpA-like protein